MVSSHPITRDIGATYGEAGLDVGLDQGSELGLGLCLGLGSGSGLGLGFGFGLGRHL